VRRALAAAIVVIVAGNVVGFLLVGDRTDPVSVDTALARYRATTAVAARTVGTATGGGSPAGTVAPSAGGAATSAVASGGSQLASGPSADSGAIAGPVANEPDPVASGPVLPPVGVYVYDTSGKESVDVTLHGEHDYPAQSTITLTRTECGMNMHWQPIEQRYDDYGICAGADGSLTLATIDAHHEFFGTAVSRSYTCDGVYVRPPSAVPGSVTQGTCSNADDRSTITSTVVGLESTLVGGVPMDALHVHMDFRISGGTNGQQTADFWLQPSDGLPLRLVLTTNAKTGTPIGNAHFVEDADLRLTSTSPLQ
jgi:hypothetical protein